jgi:hypothetical protein
MVKPNTITSMALGKEEYARRSFRMNNLKEGAI